MIPISHYWAKDAIFYAIYPLGFCGAPTHNDFHSVPVNRLRKIQDWLPHLQELGVNALYLGPVFESSAHGYDTTDYYHVDRRLGTDTDLSALAAAIHATGMHLILDGVFNHVGRDFWAFRDVKQHLQASEYVDWFDGLSFDNGHSSYDDSFTYRGWSGNYDLVKLNLQNPAVRQHLFGAVRTWVDEFGIDGLRLDAADCLNLDFLRELHDFTRTLRPDFWLMGEIVHGDYRTWANPAMLDSVTNYECYKGLYSSLAEKNYFEIAYALNRQFGPEGIYRDLPLYAFVDNHDVNRVASNLPNPTLLYPLYCLLFTMPGVPSIYYGSEWGISGKRTPYSDHELRPCLDRDALRRNAPQPDLPSALRKLSNLRSRSPALKYGSYQQIYVSHEQLAFLREAQGEQILVVLNAAAAPVPLELRLPTPASHAIDLLNPGETFPLNANKLTLPAVPSCWARVLLLK